MRVNRLIQGDCISVMKYRIPASSVDLIFADPPFNIGYSYDQYQDKLPYEEYVSWTVDWLSQAKKCLKPSGSLFVAIGDDYAAEVKIVLRDLKFHFRNWIVWRYGFGVSCRKKFARSHTHILYVTCDKKRFTFNDRDIRVPSDRQTKYADKRANPLGKIPDDVWDFSRICGTFRERAKDTEGKSSHPCQMPEQLLERIIRVASNPGDTVFDPFAGSGTTLAVAHKLKRKWLGTELSEEYIRGAQKRISLIESDSRG